MSSKLLRGGAAVAGISAIAAAVVHALAGNWDTTTWAALAGAAWMLHVAHSCPRPPVPERGRVAVSFHGGPMDGADVPLPPVELPELCGTRVEAKGARYRVMTVERTCYAAELEAPTAGGDR